MPAPLLFVDPLPITAAMMIDSNVPEDDAPAYSSGTTYALDARVVFDHQVWESLQAANLNHSPATSPDWWALVGPTNRWRCYDGKNASQTTRSTSITYQLEPGLGVTAMAALNVKGCITWQVEVTHPTYGTLYDRTVEMRSLPTVPGPWGWCFGARTRKSVAVLTDLPGIPGCTIDITFTGTTDLAVGVLLLGQIKAIGMGVRAGARIGITDYSRKEANEWGEVVLVERAFAKRASFDLPIAAALVDEAVEFFASIRAKPVLCIGSNAYGSTVVFGFIKEFDVVIAYASVSECSLTMEGLT